MPEQRIIAPAAFVAVDQADQRVFARAARSASLGQKSSGIGIGLALGARQVQVMLMLGAEIGFLLRRQP
jgi:hypothetical protein